MKNLINSIRIGLILLAVFGLFSCEERGVDSNGIGTAEFSIIMPDDVSDSKSAISNDSAVLSFQILISVEDMAGSPVFTDILIPIYTFGSAFVSENIEINAGEYKLTKFMVINPSGEVVFASPLEESPLAYLCNHPLPIIFNIQPRQVTRIVPEVLVVGEQTPDQFGYASFGVQVIKPLEFWTMVVLDPGNPMIMAPIQITNAKLTVYTRSGWHYSFRLQANINHVIVRGGSDLYYFVLEKEGYLTQKMQFTANELRSATADNPLMLKIPWGSATNVLVLQPGPERGKDAMISNLQPETNFGEYKYFEATFLSEPVLTVMRTNNSLISFNHDALPSTAKIQKVILRLSYEFPLLYDSTILTNNYLVWFGGVLQQIVEPWEESQVTWDSQPKTIEANQVFISPFIRNVNFIDVDVTSLFVPVQEIAAPNWGLLFKQYPSDQFPGFRFASSDFPEATMRPKLTIYYTIN